jgi:hypothetical protein
MANDAWDRGFANLQTRHHMSLLEPSAFYVTGRANPPAPAANNVGKCSRSTSAELIDPETTKKPKLRSKPKAKNDNKENKVSATAIAKKVQVAAKAAAATDMCAMPIRSESNLNKTPQNKKI